MNKERLFDWYLSEWRRFEHEWGRTDCACFMAHWLVKLGYPDLMEPYRGRYSSAEGAVEALLEAGGMAGILEAALGPSLPVLSLGRGDIAVGTVEVEDGPTECGGLVTGSHVAVPGNDSLMRLRLTSFDRGWRVSIG